MRRSFHVRMLAIASMLLFISQKCEASIIYWTDWKTSSNVNGFTANGTITTSGSVVDVTYNNPQGVGFYYTGAPGETDYWQHGGDITRSPYTSALVDNDPTGTDMIALQFAGRQTLSFSEAIANPVFSYISLNGNGYAFDQDFDILSFGDGVINDAGYWGAGTSFKEIVEVSPGVFEYRLLGTGEPHGTIRFKGSFSTVSWRSLTNEFWNGFTVGIQGTDAEVFGVPEPTSMTLLGVGVVGLACYGWKRRRNGNESVK